MEMCFKRLGVVITTTAVRLQYYFFFYFLAAFISSGVHSRRLPVGLWTDHYLARRHLSNFCSGIGISHLVSLHERKHKTKHY